MRQIYLDYNATTPVAPSVQEAMLPFLAEHYGNPSNRYSLGRAASEALEDARGQVAVLLGAEREEIVFTAGGTESNNLALKGVLFRDHPTEGGHLILSAIEHPSVLEPARFLQKLGYAVTVVGCNSQGLVDPEMIEAAMRPDTKLVSVILAHNETGVIQPLRTISALCKARGVWVHTDASQAVGKIRVAVNELGVDLLTVAGHKFYAPKGVGALFVRRGTPLTPLLHGGGQEAGLRSGTENVASIVGLGKAGAMVAKCVDEAHVRLSDLRDRLWESLAVEIGPTLKLHGGKTERLPNTLFINFPGVSGAELLAQASEIFANTGSACHGGESSVSPILLAMGVLPDEARGTIRLSLGWYTSEEEIDRAASILLGAWESLRR